MPPGIRNPGARQTRAARVHGIALNAGWAARRRRSGGRQPVPAGKSETLRPLGGRRSRLRRLPAAAMGKATVAALRTPR